MTKLHEVTESEGELEDYAKGQFYDYFEDEDNIFANNDTYNEFRNEDFV